MLRSYKPEAQPIVSEDEFFDLTPPPNVTGKLNELGKESKTGDELRRKLSTEHDRLFSVSDTELTRFKQRPFSSRCSFANSPVIPVM